MRVSGSGTGGSYNGGGSRSDRFRNRHRPGQKVRGVLVKNLPDSMAWVDIDGERLLAQLETARPEGSRLLFLVQQLVPRIILKELTGEAHGNAATALTRVSDFDSARTLFENRFRPVLHEAGLLGSPLPLPGFLALLAADPLLHAAYQDAANCANPLSGALRDADKGTLSYQPWLAPTGRRQATIMRHAQADSQLTEILVEFDHARMGLTRVQFLRKAETLSCRVQLQHPEHAQSLSRYLDSRQHPGSPFQIRHLGVGKLPRTSHSGILAELLFKR
ncbi:hypothetical protein BerOc1_00198 [Pseudodesulfovibrio hydrargyri]|uniref:Flagellar hook-length control protein FliK n=1 Tax=Pseudodesulfovibrio hydrargyri TaxID=2125990 RepID=A0A1J5MYZ8_9BACT|nr:hypothetical protein [Pseudodesulfovibrio hydrargyri]OIQ51741.1 hypothetical protein BerOc1_00198 [Pseudodesulfovibrio hydrargyri]